MDFEFLEQEREFLREVDQFLVENYDPNVMDVTRENMAQVCDTPERRAFMKKLAARGWLGITWPRAADVQAAIDHDGCGLHPARAIETEVPGQAEAGHIAGIDGAQRAEAGFGGIEAMLSPLGGRAGGC